MGTERVAKLTAAPGHCRGCGKRVFPPRRSWCSDACVQDALVTLDPAVARHRVEQRDRGVCAECGFDAQQAERILNRLNGRYLAKDLGAGAAAVLLVNTWTEPKRQNRASGLWRVPHLWEADHIQPVVEGGGGCGLENYRTLCIPCHKSHTRALARRRAEARRLSGMGLLESALSVDAVDPVDRGSDV